MKPDATSRDSAEMSKSGTPTPGADSETTQDIGANGTGAEAAAPARDSAPGATSAFNSNPERLASIATFIGVALYVTHFSAYHRFYSTLGLQPEDVGVSYVYLLTRSIAFAILLGVPLFYAVLLGNFIRRQTVRPFREARFNWFIGLYQLATMNLAAAAALYLIVSGTVSGWLPLIVWGTVAVAVALDMSFIIIKRVPPVIQRPSGRYIRRPQLLACMFVASAFVAVAGGLTQAASSLASDARLGFEVTPMRLLGFSLLDVEASPAWVEWVGAEEQRPSIFPDAERACLHLVGQGPATLYAITPLSGPVAAGQLVRLPLSSVATTPASGCGLLSDES
jgi:hypothetical protein